MHKNGFTLAEVLLTLAIIGVVAALTIPAVITKVTQDQYVVGLKKAYNTLKSVQREAEQEHGPMENWDWDGTEHIFEKYFKPHFDITKTCEGTEKGCWAEALTYLNGDPLDSDFNTPDFYRFITSDGVAWLYQGEDFRVDINALKGPNRNGRDIFYFYLQGTPKSFKPSGWEMSTENINDECNSSGSGDYCTTKVLAEGAMNY